MKEEVIPVLFRMWKNEGGQEVIAIFPTLPGTYESHTCDSYEHVGQHGACDPQGLIGRTRLATEPEYRALKHELESEPYNYKFRVIKRLSYSYEKIRCAAIERTKS
jgi:hypothetical protein